MDLGIPLLKKKHLLESNPSKSRSLLHGFAVRSISRMRSGISLARPLGRICSFRYHARVVAAGVIVSKAPFRADSVGRFCPSPMTLMISSSISISISITIIHNYQYYI